MKKFIILFLILIIASPVYSVPNWTEGANDNVKFYDDSEYQEYARQLKEKFHKKYVIKISPTESRYTAPMNAYEREVISPSIIYGIQHPPKYNDR